MLLESVSFEDEEKEPFVAKSDSSVADRSAVDSVIGVFCSDWVSVSESNSNANDISSLVVNFGKVQI